MKSSNKGFTMIELLFVIIILFIISAVIGNNIDLSDYRNNEVVQEAPKQTNNKTGWN